jgi:hypothetical protein
VIRLAIRGYADGVKVIDERMEAAEERLEGQIPALAAEHAARLASLSDLMMVEIEFLDEPDPFHRYFRFGTDPSRMVDPIKVGLP